jgi:inosose dehydratase
MVDATQGEAVPRIAGAPISWGVCEVPGWGPMLPADRVMRELNTLGLSAIELGAPGFLPDDPTEAKAAADAFNVELIGGFVPVVLHDPAWADRTRADIHAWSKKLAAASATWFVTAVVVDPEWSPRYELNDAEWAHLVMMLGEIDRITANYGVKQALHPHVGTLVETATDVQHILDHSDVGWCLDIAHLSVGGYNPVEFVTNYGDRVRHVHLKDVNLVVAARLNAGELTLKEAVFEGLFCALGEGQIDVAGTISALEAQRYDGWYVLEQDTSIEGTPPPEGSGPVEAVRVSLQYVQAVTAA